MNHELQGGRPSERRRRRVLALSPLLLSLGSCASLLGIEDVHEGSAPGNGGDGTGATAGESNDNGGTGNGGGTAGGGATAPLGGDAPMSAGAGNAEAGMAGMTGVAGEDNTGGAPPHTGPNVHGKVIDFWGRNVPNIPVQIGDTLVSTNADGEFEIADVTPEYNVSLAIELDSITTHGWFYEGLTRRDPTLQVYSGNAPREGRFELPPLDVTVESNQTAKLSIGAVGGADEFNAYENGLESSFYWRGPAAIQGQAHALFWQFDTDTALPTSYLGFYSTLVAFDEANTTTIPISLAGDVLDSDNVQGTVTTASNASRANYVYLRFPSGDRITLVEDYPSAPNTFSYLVPSTPAGSITVAGVEGYAPSGAFSVTHRGGLAPGNTANLAMHLPGTLVAPGDGATKVDGTTSFSFVPGAGSGAAHLIAVRNIYDSCCFDALHIVTTKTQFELPEILGTNFMRPGEGYYWRVETHGSYDTLDEMTGPTGFLDPFSADEATPQGPRMGNGSYTVTNRRVFTAAP